MANTLAYARPKKAKKVVPLEQHSKAELITLVKKLQKQVAKMQADIGLVNAALKPAADEYQRARYKVVHDLPEGVEIDLVTGDIREVPAFPWEKK